MAPRLLIKKYDQLVRSGQIRSDAAQREVLNQLQSLREQMEHSSKKPSLFARLFSKGQNSNTQGIYMWGGVGRGKSMLMDMFYENINIERKRRVHFHAFMQEVHARIHEFRQNANKNKTTGDPVVLLAQEIIRETSLLCFDELQATDVADATLLHRLFSEFFASGVIIVSTSNHPPASLYTGGVQKERFNKFIALLEEKMLVTPLASTTDYRHAQMKSLKQTYFWPLGKKADAFIYDALEKMNVNTNSTKGTLTIQGRKLEFRLYDQSIGRFRFDDLCAANLGAADYLAIADKLDTLILTGIPKLPPEKRNEAKRFVTLIDALYEHKVKLLATAEVAPKEIYTEGDGAFEFQRTVSRLMEMQSNKWIADE